MLCSLTAYNIPNWYVLPRAVKTNTAGNTFCRSPGLFLTTSLKLFMNAYSIKYTTIHVVILAVISISYCCGLCILKIITLFVLATT